MNKAAELKVKGLTWEMVGGIENAIMDGEDDFLYWQDLSTAEKVEEVYRGIIRNLEKEVRFIGTEGIKKLIEKYL